MLLFIAGCVSYLVAFCGVVDLIRNVAKKTKGYDAKVSLLAIVLLSGFGYWATSSSVEEHSEGQEKVHIPANSAAIAKVRATQPDKVMVPGKTAELQGGIIVYYDGPVYWVSGDTVYAVNGIAKNWSPGIAYAPAEITYTVAEKAIEQRYSSPGATP